MVALTRTAILVAQTGSGDTEAMRWLTHFSVSWREEQWAAAAAAAPDLGRQASSDVSCPPRQRGAQVISGVALIDPRRAGGGA